MSLAKNHLVSSLNNRCGFSNRKSINLIKSILETIKRTLESGEDILISGFGKFSVKEKKEERRGRNPATGSDLILRSRRIVTFKCSEKLKDMINGKGR